MKRNRHTLSYLLTPDYLFDRYDQITPEFLKDLGIRGLLIDIDNTLAPYEQSEPDERIHAWFDSLRVHGIRAALISNNHPPRVERFNATLGLPAYPDSGKPGSRALLAAMKEMEVTPAETAGLGDQLLTDTLAAHRLDLISMIVPPIKDKTTLFFRFKRLLEKPFLRRYRRRKRKEDQGGSGK
ncbi:MAG: YqeG family HAD IIIA-type phosphatase [Clostridia bacterium]|nr:YqeG family HAD IIIA-type phosphatase [Clostridia bacterium]